MIAVAFGILVLATSPVMAGPASKFAAEVSSVALVCKDTKSPCEGVSNLGWTKVLETVIKTPNKKDLLIGVSFETGLYTQTLVKSSGGTKDTSNATATLKIRVKVDGNPAKPGDVVYDKRSQTLSAVLGGYYANCLDENEDGIIDVTSECDLLPEEIELILDTMAAHHFNFVVANLLPGEHTVKVEAMIDTDTSYQSGSASATALVGKGSLTVEEVRATNSPDGIVFLE